MTIADERRVQAMAEHESTETGSDGLEVRRDVLAHDVHGFANKSLAQIAQAHASGCAHLALDSVGGLP